jgi:hypothetical protein
MMLSFAIFVTFLVFLFSVIQPMIKTGQDKKLILDSLRTELVEMLETTYSGGSIKTLDAEFVTSLSQLAEEYSNDYSGLKTDLKIPSGSEFAFNFVNTEGTMEVIAETNIPSTVNVYANEIPVYYTGGEANVLLGFLNTKVW